ncbi:unnamed protein product [Mytilus coruscus]|uniref:DZIP3-like HEPN domain-containing protein n=1 Tax=Mytilus coruscus TaxID=42192 RepID=A0A6J8DNA2_MYTCO|nr:unnamed protein product [Mytilus coruscus]
MNAIKEIIENNVDEVKKDLQALIEDQKKSTLLVKDEIIAHLTKYKASCSTEETFDIEVPKMNASASGSKVYVTETDKNNRDEMRTAVHLFLEKFVEVCRINSDEHTVIKVALITEPDELDKEEAKEQSSKIEMNKKDKTTCIFCNKSFDCQNCQQKAKTISRLEDELSKMDKDSPEIKFESDLENIGNNFRANKAQVATGHVLSPNANYARLIIAVKHITQNMLKEVLEHFIPPRTLVTQVRYQKWTQRLKPSDLKKINDAKNKGYIDFDLPLIYTILRNFRLDILPTRGWNHPTDPQQHEISLGDDIERCRRLYNVIIHRPNAMIMMISSQEFNDFLSDFKCIAKRFEIVLNKQPNEFVSQFKI